MQHLNTPVFNNVNLNSLSLRPNKTTWLETINVDNAYNISLEYERILRKFEKSRKWIILINPDKNHITTLAKKEAIGDSQLNMSKVLCIHTNKVTVTMESIVRTLGQGNCSAIILCNPTINSEEITYLSEKASQGKTACIVLMQDQTIH